MSVASIWEIAIKKSLGKLALEISIDDLIEAGAVENGIGVMEITRPHVTGVAELALHHRDPFDRLLVSQAMSEDMAIISRDRALDAYPFERIW